MCSIKHLHVLLVFSLDPLQIFFLHFDHSLKLLNLLILPRFIFVIFTLLTQLPLIEFEILLFLLFHLQIRVDFIDLLPHLLILFNQLISYLFSFLNLSILCIAY